MYLAPKIKVFPADELNGFTALHYAAEKGYVEIAEIICNCSACEHEFSICSLLPSNEFAVAC
jgi:hypothetical protein